MICAILFEIIGAFAINFYNVCSQLCAYRWSFSDLCWHICSDSDDQVCVIYYYETGTWMLNQIVFHFTNMDECISLLDYIDARFW